MEQLSTPLVSAGESDGGPLGGGTSAVRNHVVKPVIPPKPEGYETLGRRQHHKSSENGSAVSLSEHRLSYSSGASRPKSGEAPGAGDMHQSASVGSLPANALNSRQSPRSPRSKAPAPPVPSSPRPPPLVALADGQERGLLGPAVLTLDGLLATAPVQGSAVGGALAGAAPSGGPGPASAGGKHQSAGFEPGQLSAWNNPLIEPPQLFQSPMDLDLSAAFEADADAERHPPPPPPPSDYSGQHPLAASEPMKPVKLNEPPRLPSVPPVATSLSISLSSMDPLSKAAAAKPCAHNAELGKMFKSEAAPNGTGHRIEPRVTSDLVKLDSSKAADADKPSRVLPLKPFVETGHKSAGQSLESIQSNTSTIDTTDSPHSANEQQQQHQHHQQQQQQQRALESVPSADVPAGAKSAPLLLPAPHPPAAIPPPPPSSYMTIDIDPGSASAAPVAAAVAAADGAEKPLEPFYPPNSFRPYSFHSECWRKEIPENETKWEMYKRRFCEFVFNFVACCIRCIGPV